MTAPRAAQTGVASCDRVTCDREATVLLLFDPRLFEAWLRDFDPDSRTVGICLCLDHANKVTVPAGWTLTDRRSTHNRIAGRPAPVEAPTPHLAPVPPIDDAEDATPDDTIATDDTATDDTAEPESPADPAGTDENTPVKPKPDADGVIERPTLWDDDEPEGLRVDESTPLLSRAFRAAHID